MALINCKECGKQISDKTNYCRHCGAPTNAERNSPTATKGVRNEETNGGNVGFIIAFVITIFVASGIIFWLINANDNLENLLNEAVTQRIAAEAALNSTPIETIESLSAIGSGEKKVCVNGVNVRLRSSPEINDYNLIKDNNGNLLHPNKGDKLTYLGEENDFYYVSFQGLTVYISKLYSYIVYD